MLPTPEKWVKGVEAWGNLPRIPPLYSNYSVKLHWLLLGYILPLPSLTIRQLIWGKSLCLAAPLLLLPVVDEKPQWHLQLPNHYSLIAVGDASTLATNMMSEFGSYYFTFECHAITWTTPCGNASDRGRTIKGETLTFYCCEREDVSPVDLAIMTRQTDHKQRWPVVSVWLSQRTRLLAVQRPWLGFQNTEFTRMKPILGFMVYSVQIFPPFGFDLLHLVQGYL